MTTVDLRASTVATLGVAADEALVAAGISPRTIRHRIRVGIWERPATGVVILLRNPEDVRQRMLVAVPAGPAGTLVSHGSAAWLHDLVEVPPSVPAVTVPRGRRYVQLPATVHTTSRLEPTPAADGPLPVTPVARTLRDLATCDLDPRSFQRAVGEALRRGQVDVDALREAAEPRGRGRRRLREAVDREVANAVHRVDSHLEGAWVAALVAAGIDGFTTQHEVRHDGRTARLDVAWPVRRVALEVDGARWHADALATAADAERQQWLESLGWLVLRVAAADLEGPRHRLALDRIRTALTRDVKAGGS